MSTGGKARPGRDADHSPPSSAEVKYEWELYLLFPHVPPRRVAGQLYFTFLLGLPCSVRYAITEKGNSSEDHIFCLFHVFRIRGTPWVELEQM
jgi:hypothetical protein